MPEMITEKTRVPFCCAEKGRPLRECSDSLLRWMVEHLWNGDLHAWAFAARKVLDKRVAHGAQLADEQALEAQADEFLRNHGYGGLCPRRRRRGA